MRRVPKNSIIQAFRNFPSERNAAEVPRTRPGGQYFERVLEMEERLDMKIILVGCGDRFFGSGTVGS